MKRILQNTIFGGLQLVSQSGYNSLKNHILTNTNSIMQKSYFTKILSWVIIAFTIVSFSGSYAQITGTLTVDKLPCNRTVASGGVYNAVGTLDLTNVPNDGSVVILVNGDPFTPIPSIGTTFPFTFTNAIPGLYEVYVYDNTNTEIGFLAGMAYADPIRFKNRLIWGYPEDAWKVKSEEHWVGDIAGIKPFHDLEVMCAYAASSFQK